MIHDINNPKFLALLAMRLRMQYGWTAKQTDTKKLKQVFLAVADIHKWEEEAKTLDNKRG